MRFGQAPRLSRPLRRRARGSKAVQHGSARLGEPEVGWRTSPLSGRLYGQRCCLRFGLKVAAQWPSSGENNDSCRAEFLLQTGIDAAVKLAYAVPYWLRDGQIPVSAV